MKRSVRAQVWLGDLLWIFSDLRPGEDEVALIARMLRLETTAASRNVPEPMATPPPSQPATQRTEHETPLDERAPRDREANQAATASRLSPASRLVRIATGNAQAEPPAWAHTTNRMAAPPKPPAAAAEPEPILAMRVRRAIVAGAVSTLAAEGAPDIRVILRTIGRGQTLVTLPRRARPTLRLGAHVLVDKWLGMAPFAADASGVAQHLQRLISPDRLRVLRFVGSPLGRMRWPVGKPRPWSPPPRGTPILVLSDFGLGGPLLDAARSDISQWLRFARMARDAGCPVVGLIPIESARWPRALTSRMTLLYWSERLTAGAVRRALAHGVRHSA
jgi:hypothetical protein